MTTAPLTVYSGSNLSGLVDSFLGVNSGISVDAGSIQLSASAADAVNLYDGSLSALGIGAGLLLTSGTTPGTSNTVGWFGQDNTQYLADGTPVNFNNGDPAIDAVVNTVFQTQSYDATTLGFNFSVTDPAATSISFDLVFGSDEYPEWVDQFVDCAVIIVNGVNYALFNHDPKAPLSVISGNLAAGYFQDNAGNVLPIEYDGVSHVLKIVAPIIPGQVNSIKIGIADTGDHIYDSGLFISNMVAGSTPGSGVVITPDMPSTQGDDIVTGSIKDELISLLGGNDIAYAGGGDDIIVAGAGNDKVYGGTGNDVMEGDQGNDLLDGGEGTANEAVYAGKSSDYTIIHDAVTGAYTITDTKTGAASEGSDTVLNVQLVKFSDGLFDLTPGGLVAHVTDPGVPANTAGSLIVSGASVVGQTLTAVVVDADGVPQSVAYQWMTSSDGVTWSDTGVSSQTFTLTAANAGQQVKAAAVYTDAHGYAEAPTSAAVTVAVPSGKVSIELMQFTAPAGGSVANPLTTLLKNAIDLGFSANEATAAIKAALGLPDISLKTFDPYAALVANPLDAAALTVMKIAGEIAIAASVSDPSGFNLTLAVMNAAATNHVLNLADPTTLSTILAGINPASLSIVEGLNKDMADAKSFATIGLVWNDYCGQVDNLAPYIGHVDMLSVHINQAPVGESAAVLAHGTADAAYVLTQADLLAGFSDPEGDALAVSALVADKGGVITDNGDGTWTFTPDAGFNGPIELSFTVSDPSGAAIAGHNMLVIDAAPVPPADTTPPSASLSSDMVGTANGDVSFSVAFSEDVTGLAVDGFTVSHGTVTSVTGSGALYTVVITPDAGFEGSVDLTLNAGAAFDAAGNANDLPASASQSVDTLAPTATITDNVSGTATGDVTYTVTFSEQVAGLDAAAFAVTHGTVTSVTGDGTTYAVVVTPDSGFEGNLGLSLTAGAVTDAAGNGNAAAAAAAQAVDTLAPTVAAFSPADGATGAATTANITVTFSEAVAIGTGPIQIRQGSPIGTLVESFDVATSARLTVNGATLTIDPATTLLDGTQYFVVMGTGTVLDLAGNAFAGTASYDFTTAVAVPTPLTLTGTAGADTLTGAALDDVLNGLGGVDSMDGKGGSDLYLIGLTGDHTAAEVHDSGASGTDEVRFTATAAGTLTLFAGDSGIEKVVTGTGTGAVANTSATTALSINAAAVTSGLTIIGNAGANTLTGTAFDDVLIGGAGNDVLKGGAGNDTASYQDASAAVTVDLTLTKAQATGGSGSDTLTGIENLIGGAGNDTLGGTAAANRIDGGAGNDKLFGGAGADDLWGRLGADTFDIRTLTDSTANARDTIWDFSHAEGDRIDLHLIDAIAGGKDQAFTFASAFTKVAGQLVSVLEGDHYAVQGDVNGDGLADFIINVHASAALVSADFIL